MFARETHERGHDDDDAARGVHRDDDVKDDATTTRTRRHACEFDLRYARDAHALERATMDGWMDDDEDRAHAGRDDARGFVSRARGVARAVCVCARAVCVCVRVFVCCVFV